MKKYVVLAIPIVIVLITLFIFLKNNNHQQTKIKKGVSLSIWSEDMKYKKNESFSVSVFIRNNGLQTINISSVAGCNMSSSVHIPLIDIDKAIYKHYEIEVVKEKNYPPNMLGCQAIDVPYYLFPGQFMYIKMKFTPKKEVPWNKRNTKVYITSQFKGNSVSLPIEILHV